MRILKIEILLLLLIGLIAYISRVSINFARFDFTYNVITIIDPDWKGAPYIVKELNVSNRHFDDAAIYFKNPSHQRLKKALDTYPDYMTSFTDDYGTIYSTGSEYEICLELVEHKVKPIKKSFFQQQYELSSLADISYYNLNYPYDGRDHHTIEFESQLGIEGIVSDAYRDQQIQEFLLHNSFQLMNEYLQPEKLRALRYQLTIIKSYLWGSMVAMGHI